MRDALLVIAPVVGLILVGLLARAAGLLGERAADGLTEYVFALAVPCLLARLLAEAHPPATVPWGYWGAYFGGVAAAWSLAMLAAARFGLPREGRVAAGFAAGQSNTVLVGIPLILKAYGDAGAGPLALLLGVHLPVTMTAATLLLEGRNADLRGVARRLATHPILLGILAGLLIRTSGLPLTGPPGAVLDAIAATATPCALIAMGAALRRYGLRAGVALPGIVTALKLGLHPLVTLLLARAFGVDAVTTGVAVLFASAPCGINAYLFAAQNRQGADVASSAVALSTVAFALTTPLWLLVLGAG